MNSLRQFLMLTAERFNYLESHDREYNFFDVYEIGITSIDGAIISKAESYELTRMPLTNPTYYAIENIRKELMEILSNQFFNEWLANRDTYFKPFKIVLRNKKYGAAKYLYDILVEVDDGFVKYY